MNTKLRKLFKIIICASPLFGFASFAFINNDLSLNNKSLTYATSKSSRLIDTHNTTQSITLNDIVPYQSISSFSTTTSYEFSEIFIAPKNEPNNRFYTLTKDGGNLIFRQEKTNEEIMQNSNLDPRPMSPNNFQISRSQIFLQEIEMTDDGVITNDLLNSTPRTGDAVGVRFDQLSGSGFFIADSRTLTFPIKQKANYIIKFHIASLDENNPLTVFFKSNNYVYSSTSDLDDLNKLNYITADNDKHTGIETVFGQSTDNKYVIAYDTSTTQQTTVFRLDINDDEIISKLGSYKASEALNHMVLNNPSANQIAWSDVINISGQVVLPIQYKNINLLIEANDPRGEIQITYHMPYSLEYKPVSGTQFRTIYGIQSLSETKKSITGFNAGTTILTDTVNMQNENITGLPQKIITDSTLIEQLKQQVFNKCFSPGSLLNNFSPTTDMRLSNWTFDNIKGTLNCNLTLLNNYIDKNGNEITSNVEQPFGQIKFTNLNKISPTSIKNRTINIPADSNLKDLLPSQAKDNIDDIRELICENISTILNNIPNATLANRDIAPADIIFSNSNISEVGRNFIKINRLSINHYYNQTNGSYENSTPFIVDNLTVAGFSEAKSTYIKNETFTIPGMNMVYVEEYTETQALDFLRQKQNDNQLLSFVDPSFNVSTDINIKSGTWVTNSQTGEIKFVLQAKNIYGADANIITQFKDLGTITLKGFKQVIKTQLVTTNYNVGNFFGEAVADEITPENIKNLLIDLFNQNMLFNTYDDAFNPNTDLAISSTDLTVNAIAGTIDVRVNAKNIYNANLTIAQNFTYVGNIHLYNFNKKISTTVNNGVYNIQSLPPAFHDLYANDVTIDNNGSANFNNIIQAFYEKGMILSNLPKDFDFATNITNINIEPTKINDEWALNATFKVNNYLIDGKTKNDPPITCTVTLIGFKQLQSTRINGTIFNPDAELLKVNCFKQHQAYKASIIENQIIDYGTNIIVSTNDQSILTSPLIEIENNPTTNPLVLDFSNATYSANNNDGSILFSNVLVSGSYYSNDSLEPIPVSNNIRKIMSIELSGFGVRNFSYTPMIVTISIIVATIIGTSILVIIVCKIYQKLRISKRRYDAYEDTVTKDMSF